AWPTSVEFGHRRLTGVKGYARYCDGASAGATSVEVSTRVPSQSHTERVKARSVVVASAPEGADDLEDEVGHRREPGHSENEPGHRHASHRPHFAQPRQESDCDREPRDPGNQEHAV